MDLGYLSLVTCLRFSNGTGMWRYIALRGAANMNDLFLRMYVAAKDALACESGQNLVEYGMAVALIAFGYVAGETAIASSVNQTFINISTVITTGIAR